MEDKEWILAQRGVCYTHRQLNAGGRRAEGDPRFWAWGARRTVAGTMHRNWEVASGHLGGRW